MVVGHRPDCTVKVVAYCSTRRVVIKKQTAAERVAHGGLKTYRDY